MNYRNFVLFFRLISLPNSAEGAVKLANLSLYAREPEAGMSFLKTAVVLLLLTVKVANATVDVYEDQCKGSGAKTQVTFRGSIRNIHQENNAGLQISEVSLTIVDDILVDLFVRISSEAKKLANGNGKGKLKKRHMRGAVYNIFPRRLGGVAISKAGEANKRFHETPNNMKLAISHHRVRRFLCDEGYAERVGAAAPVYAASILGTVARQVLDGAGYASKAAGKSRIQLKDIEAALQNDKKLRKLLFPSFLKSLRRRSKPNTEIEANP